MVEILERGSVHFLYRPRVHAADDLEVVQGVEDVAAAYLVLRVEGGARFRRVLLGRKRLPGPRERAWAFVERVTTSAEPMRAELDLDVYETRTRGLRVQPPARVAGEGVYALAGHDDHAHLAYVLDLPRAPGDVQAALGIAREGHVIVAVRNPEAPYPPGLRPRRRGRRRLPPGLTDRFGGRRFAPAAPELLDLEGVELVLVGQEDPPGQALGVELDPSSEAALRENLFAQLRAHGPLVEGRWE